MDPACLNKIKTFTNKDVIDLFRKYKQDEFEPTLIKRNVTGETLLKLNELNILSWKLKLTEKRKFLAFLQEIQTNPQEFVTKTNNRGVALNRRQSFSQKGNDFKEKLELMIGVKPMVDPKPKKPPPKPPSPETPVEEYLCMEGEIETNPRGFAPKTENRNNSVRRLQNVFTEKLNQVIGEEWYENKPNKLQSKPESPEISIEEYEVVDEDASAHYDEGGYLRPGHTILENEYEQAPSGLEVSSNPIWMRKPQTLPRPNTDDRGYITGPKPDVNSLPPPLLPRIQHRRQPSPIRINEVSPQSSPTSTSPRRRDFPGATVPPAPAFKTWGVNPSVLPATPTDNDLVTYDIIDNDAASNAACEQVVVNLSETADAPCSGKFKWFNKLISKTTDPATLEHPTLTGSLERLHIRRKRLDSTTSLPNSSPEPGLKNRPLPALPLEEIKSEQAYLEMPSTSRNSDQEIELRQPVLSPVDSTDVNMEQHVNPENVAQSPKLAKHKQNSTKKTHRRLPLPPSSLPSLPLDPVLLRKDSPDEELQDYSNIIQNLNDEPFYRNTDRKGARLLLFDLADGAFLFRKSRRYFLTLSLKYNQQVFNLGINRTANNKICLITEEDGTSPEFSTLAELVSHFMQEQVAFLHKGREMKVYLQPILPAHRF